MYLYKFLNIYILKILKKHLKIGINYTNCFNSNNIGGHDSIPTFFQMLSFLHKVNILNKLKKLEVGIKIGITLHL